MPRPGAAVAAAAGNALLLQISKRAHGETCITAGLLQRKFWKPATYATIEKDGAEIDGRMETSR